MPEYYFVLHVGARGSVDRILVRLLSSMEEIKQTQKMHSTMLQSLMRQIKGSDILTAVPQLPVGVPFPLESLEEMDDLEIHLKDEAASKKVVNRFYYSCTSFYVYILQSK